MTDSAKDMLPHIHDEKSRLRTQASPKYPHVHFHPVQKSQLPMKVKPLMHLWAIVQATLFAWSPNCCRGFRRLLLRAFGARLSPTASIHNKARIDCPWNLEMDDFASIGEHAWIYALDRIRIGSRSCVGQRVLLITGTHDHSDPAFSLITKPITIGDGVWLAVGAKVLPGITLHNYCVVGAGSIVTKDMPEMMVCAGNPCRPVKKRRIRS